MQAVFALGLMFITVGVTGFTTKGLPLTSKRRLSGGPGRATGALCLTFGALVASAAFWAGSPTERHDIGLMTRGVVVGVLGTVWVVCRPV